MRDRRARSDPRCSCSRERRYNGAALTNVLGRFLQREIFGVPMNVFLQYVVPVLAVPFLILFKYGKPRGYLADFFHHHAKAKVYCGLEPDRDQTSEYLREGVGDAADDA